MVTFEKSIPLSAVLGVDDDPNMFELAQKASIPKSAESNGSVMV